MAIPAWLAALYASKWFLPSVMTGAMLTSTGMSEVGRSKERKMTKEQLRMQQLLQEASVKATKKDEEETRKNTEKLIKELKEAKAAEARQMKENAMMQTFLDRQGQSMEMMLQALGGMTSRPSSSSSSGGMLNIMRQGY